MNELQQEVVSEEVKDEVKTVEAKPQTAPKAKKKFSFLEYLANIWFQFLDSFKYNPCKLSGILIALPGIFLGFFLEFHSKVRFIVVDGSLDLSGFFMFVMILFGCLNIFEGVTFSSKRNLGTLVVSAICTLVITVFGILWIYSIINSFVIVNKGLVDLKTPLVFDANYVMSIIGVVLAIITSVTGCILGYFKRDKNYKKVKF